MINWKRLAIVVMGILAALVMATNLSAPAKAEPLVMAGFTDTPTFTVEPPTNTPVPPTNTPIPPTNTPVPPPPQPSAPTATPEAVAYAPPATPSTGGYLNLGVLLWVGLTALVGGGLVWGLSRPRRAPTGEE